MELKLDTARYMQLSLKAAGIKYNAVSGTSIGELNGVMMTMRDPKRAIDAWKYIKLTDIINVREEDEDEDAALFRRCAVF